MFKTFIIFIPLYLLTACPRADSEVESGQILRNDFDIDVLCGWVESRANAQAGSRR